VSRTWNEWLERQRRMARLRAQAWYEEWDASCYRGNTDVDRVCAEMAARFRRREARDAE